MGNGQSGPEPVFFSEIRKHKTDLQRIGISRIGIFGSCARGDCTDNSDLDVIVEFRSGKKSFTSYMMVCDIIERCTGRRVDIVTTESISPYLLPYIQDEAIYEEL